MQNFYEKLRAMDAKTAKIWMIAAGILSGILVWFALIFSSNTKDGLLAMAFVAVFLLIMFFKYKVRKETEWDTRPFNLTFALSLLVCIIAYTIYGMSTGILPPFFK